ncbi:unnamed protein product [Effrenium voratum]|nr:unnamed protein product [Effrenium voratum]
MPLDKSRIQGFGSSNGPAQQESSWFASSSTAAPQAPKCPAGHELAPWCAKPGWCDGCGAKIKAGQPVMDCRQCNYYLCRTCAPQAEAEEEAPSFWGAVASLTDMGSGPAISSALDNVALSIGDVIDAATQDMSEMASDFKSFVASAVGIEDESGDEAERQKAAAMKKSIESVSPRSRQEATSAISDFCQKYPAARVRPNSQELEKLWAKISCLKPVALTSAFYEELSFANGDTSWQPRLRVLYALEHLFKQGGTGKEVAMSTFGQARGLIQHLVEVQQCSDKAQEVTKLFTGKVEEDPGSKADTEGTDKAKPAVKAVRPEPEAAPDLLDMSEPAPVVAAPASTLGDLDLLVMDSPAPAASLPQDLDLLAPAAAARPSPTPFDMTTSLPGSPGTTWILEAALLAAAPPSGPGGYGGAQLGAKAKAPYIPSVLETSPKPKDPFSFVSDLTGIGDATAKS